MKRNQICENLSLKNKNLQVLTINTGNKEQENNKALNNNYYDKLNVAEKNESISKSNKNLNTNELSSYPRTNINNQINQNNNLVVRSNSIIVAKNKNEQIESVTKSFSLNFNNSNSKSNLMVSSVNVSRSLIQNNETKKQEVKAEDELYMPIVNSNTNVESDEIANYATSLNNANNKSKLKVETKNRNDSNKKLTTVSIKSVSNEVAKNENANMTSLNSKFEKMQEAIADNNAGNALYINLNSKDYSRKRGNKEKSLHEKFNTWDAMQTNKSEAVVSAKGSKDGFLKNERFWGFLFENGKLPTETSTEVNENKSPRYQPKNASLSKGKKNKVGNSDI